MANLPARIDGGGWRGAATLAALAAVIIFICVSAQSRYSDELSLLMHEGPWLTIAALAAVGLARRGAEPLMDRVARAGRPRLAIWALAAATLIALLLIARFVLDAFPNSGDEYSYILQANTYARGKLWVPTPPLQDFFSMDRYFAKDGKWVSPYQPGWPLVLTPFVLAHLPLWTVAPLLGAIMVLVYFRLARSMADTNVGWLATLSMVTSPFFLLNYGSYFSHGVGALATAGFALFGVNYLKGGRWWTALLAGALAGYLGFVRAFDAVFLVLAFGGALLLTPGRRIGLVWFGLGGAPWLLALTGYYAAVTGHPLLPVQEWARSGNEPLGAPNSRSIEETFRRVVRLYFWTSPLFVVAWAPSLVVLARRRALTFVDWIAPLTVLGFVFYGGSAGNQYGPRYYFEAWPFALLSVARALEPVVVAPTHRWRGWAAAAILVHLVYQVSYCLPRFAREHDVIAEREDILRDVAAAKLSNAVVIVASPAGVSRPMWPLDLARNGLDPLNRSVVFVRDLGARNSELRGLFPSRRFFIYREGRLSPEAPSGR